MQYIVFGATGYIGSYVFEQLKREGIYAIGTGRNINGEEKIYSYDIQKHTIDELIQKVTDRDRVAIVCIAESNIDRCAERYREAYKVNVTQTKELIHELTGKGFRVIFFSSDQVFDGIQGEYTEESERNPVNKYGMMKKEMEDYLLLNEPETCILRIPKVVSPLKMKQNVLFEWTNGIRSGGIRCIRGNKLSFVSIDDIYKACRIVAEKKLKGLFQIAGDRSYSRAELAYLLYSKLGVDKVEIIECDVNDFHFKDRRPLNVGMKNTKFKAETGYSFESMEEVVDRYITDLSK